MSQRSEKLHRRMSAIEQRVSELGTAQEKNDARIDRMLVALQVRSATDDAKARRKLADRARTAERAAGMWRGVAYAALIISIIILIIAILAVRAAGVETEVRNEPSPVEEVAQLLPEPQEDYENEKIEAALLAKAHVIENCKVSHYDCCEACCGKSDGITETGVRATPGVTVAVDPDVIPMGSDVLVDYGDGEIHYYRADDVGGAIKGNHIDLCVGSHEEALTMGVRTATVYWVAQEDE
uniref:Lytic transglycosylase n=1 Tax=Siphoviridae sp. ctP6113 TaxID=2826318 RepID=A0A8S5MTP4_9CAUD|nr:MAG TPA: lytic transglycosylase [Siphoviridae sp. ctP6113]